MNRALKTLLSLFLGILLTSSSAVAQSNRYGYVDSEYILDQIPEYRSAQKQLDDLSLSWKEEVEKQVQNIDKLYKAYQAEWVLLPEDARKKREEEIAAREKGLNDYKKEKFGPEGELFKKRQQLIKPIQDRVFDAIQTYAKDNSMDFIFDKAGALTMLYSNVRLDKSNDILTAMGVPLPAANPKK